MHSNFITPPDLIETVLIVNATEEEIKECADACRNGDRAYNVYFYHTDMQDFTWLAEAVQRSDIILQAVEADVPVLCPTTKFGPEQELKHPQDYFNK
jgi:ornithine cyclodeaminase/alanine dehydrogenase-like protein (mu-crystallin family)